MNTKKSTKKRKEVSTRIFKNFKFSEFLELYVNSKYWLKSNTMILF